jgi:hypothetical protein
MQETLDMQQKEYSIFYVITLRYNLTEYAAE